MSALARTGERAARLARAVIPDPFVIAVLLLAVAFAGGLLMGEAGPLQLASAFSSGMMDPGLLAFGFQMALILATGGALAQASWVQRPLARLAEWPSTSGNAAAMVACVSMLLGLLNWGFGLLGGAFLARAVGESFARRGLPLNYPVVGASGYLGMLVWHGGLSASAPLKVASDGAFGPAIDVRFTLFSPQNLLVTGLVLVLVTLFFRALGRAAAALHPSLASAAGPAAGVEAGAGEVSSSRRTSGGVDRLERSPAVMAIFALPLGAALVWWVWTKGTAAVTLEWVILLFWLLGLLLHRSLRAYAHAFGAGAAGAGGILLQFPVYFGILAVLREAGALPLIAGGIASLATATEGVFPPSFSTAAATYFSSALLNIFVPSGGGQWALQSPIILETSGALGLERAPLVMAFAYGDQLTNMLQPFWALPLLSITRLRAGEVMGYTLLALVVAAPVYLLGLALF